MRSNILYCTLLIIALLSLFSCQEDLNKGMYKDDYSTLYTFLEENENYSIFKSIVDTALIDGTEQSMRDIYNSFNHYSPEGTNRGYTLFLPDNAALEAYLIEKSISLAALLSNSSYCYDLARHHLLVRLIMKKGFINGALSDSSLNGEYHVIRFLEMGDEVGYLVDERASVQRADIVEANGVIHLIDRVLEPLTQTSCGWLDEAPEASEYSIFLEALKLTALYDSLELIDTRKNPFTMFVEANSVFAKKDINSLADLINDISPDNNDYTNKSNPLYQFLGYHILPRRLSYSDLTQSSGEVVDSTYSEVSRTTKKNYNTFAYYPLQITIDEQLSLRDNLLAQVGINNGLADYDTIISNGSGIDDTLIIDYISIFEDISNMPTLSGVMHFINYVLEVNTSIKPVARFFEFREDPNINYYFQNISNKRYSYNEEDLDRFTFEGDLTEFSYLWSEDSNGARNGDYISFTGNNFTLSYRTTAVMQGNYIMNFKVKVDESLGFIEVYVDGEKLGNNVNFSSKGPNASGFNTFEQGRLFLEGFQEHTVSIKAITPCKMTWDYFQFEPF